MLTLTSATLLQTRVFNRVIHLKAKSLSVLHYTVKLQ